MKICLWARKYLMKLVYLTSVFPFLVLSESRETSTSDNVEGKQWLPFSLPGFWRHWSSTSRMTRVYRLRNGPQKHMLKQCHESKSQMWIFAIDHAMWLSPNSRSAQLPNAIILHGGSQASSLSIWKASAESSTLQVQGSSPWASAVPPATHRDADLFNC